MQLKITNDDCSTISEFYKLIARGIVIYNSEAKYMLNIHVDSFRSKGFYIQASTLFFGDNWIGTISNGNEVYLRNSAGTLISKYHPLRKENQSVMPVVDIPESELRLVLPTFSAQYSSKARAAYIANSMFPRVSKFALDSAPHLLCLLARLKSKNSATWTPQSGYTDEDSISDISNVSSCNLNRS